jgi:hypothetical protein
MFFAVLLVALAAVAHPVFPPSADAGRVESLKNLVAQEMNYTPQQLADMVPPQRGVAFSGCPNCYGGAQEYNVTIWKLGMGDEVVCQFCQMRFPNEKFPYNREHVITAPSGVRQVYRWHEDKDGNEFFYDARAWFERSYLWQQTKSFEFAELFALTGDNQYGDRAAALLGRFAVVYPDYPMIVDWPSRKIQFYPADQKYPYEGAFLSSVPSKLYHWAYGDIPSRSIQAYDLLRGAGYDFSRVAPFTAPDIVEKIDANLIRMSYDFFVARPDQSNNMMPYIYEDMIVAGRVGGYPEMIHHALNGTRKLAATRYFSDGWWYEGTGSYHWQTIIGLNGIHKSLKGYSDPPDWKGGELLLNADLLRDIPIVGLATQVADEAVFPDGRMIPINDTHAYDKRAPLERSVSHLWGGLGHAVSGAGEGESQFQVHLNWSGNFGHDHRDNGALILFSFGREMFSDLGYTHTKYRNWTLQTASHNTVVIDTVSQDPAKKDPFNGMGDLLFYDASHPQVRVIDLDAAPAYPAAEVYRRRLVHVHAGEGRDYVLDVFDVEGGSTHDYFLHGSADESGELATTPTLTQPVATLIPAWGGNKPYVSQYDVDYRGRSWHAYAFLRNVRTGDGAAQAVAQWTHGADGLRTRLFGPEGSQLYVFDSPSIRPADEDDNRLDDVMSRGVMLRHAGEVSRFAAVHEAFCDAPWIESAEFADGVFRVTRGGVTDVVRFEPDRIRAESSEGWHYDSGESFTGTVRSVSREGRFTLRLDRPLPELRAVRITIPGARSYVLPVESVEGDLAVVSLDPGIHYDAASAVAQYVFYPGTSHPGKLTYVAYPR